MKKKCAAILLSCVTIFSSVVYAESIDFSTYTDDELHACYESILEEYVNRGSNKEAVLKEGLYEAGTDIPSGRYEFYCTQDDIKDKHVYLLVYASAEDEQNHNTDMILYDKYIEEMTSDQPYSISLKDGQVVKVVYGSCHAVLTPGVLFN